MGLLETEQSRAELRSSQVELANSQSQPRAADTLADNLIACKRTRRLINRL